jgi:hypothetical protein
MTTRSMTLVLEPWGRSYTIGAGTTVEFRMMSGAPAPAISIVIFADAVAVHIEQDDEAPELYCNGGSLG